MFVSLYDKNKNLIETIPVGMLDVKEEVILDYSEKILGHREPCVLEREMLKREVLYDLSSSIQNYDLIYHKNETIFDFSNLNIKVEYIQYKQNP